MIFSWNGLHPTSESDGLTTKIKASFQINIYLRTNSPVVAENCNLCYPFSPDVRCASLYGVEFVFTKERREKKAQRRSRLKGLQRLKLASVTNIICHCNQHRCRLCRLRFGNCKPNLLVFSFYFLPLL